MFNLQTGRPAAPEHQTDGAEPLVELGDSGLGCLLVLPLAHWLTEQARADSLWSLVRKRFCANAGSSHKPVRQGRTYIMSDALTCHKADLLADPLVYVPSLAERPHGGLISQTTRFDSIPRGGAKLTRLIDLGA